MSKQKRHFTAQQKVAILRRHFLDKVPVSEVCQDNDLQPTVFYRRQKQFFENGEAAFEKKPGKKVREREQRVVAAPEARPRIISDNGPQFIAGDFKEFIKLSGFSHVRTSPYYPQSNGKKERWYQTLKNESIRQRTPLSLDDARRIVAEFIEYYNTVRLHSAIGYLTPQTMLEGRAQRIWDARDAKLEAAREVRRLRRLQLRRAAGSI